MNSNRQLLYRGRIIQLELIETELPNGAAAKLEIVRHPGGSAVVALDAESRVCLLRQYRYAFDDWLWELPAGKIDTGEQPLGTAQRELGEEAGLAARHWTALGKIISSPGVFTEIVHLYMARQLSPLPLAHEAEELIEIHWLPLDAAWQRAMQGEIHDAKTVIGLCRAHALLTGRPRIDA